MFIAHPPLPEPARRWRRRAPDRLLIGGLAAYALLRLPALFEPPWHVDEAGYTITAWLAGHGAVLYQGVWNNKPPLLFWTYELAFRLFGEGEFGLHLLSGLAGLATLVAIWLLVRPRTGRWRAAGALGLAAVLLGTPLLNGDLALPEDFLIAGTSWAMVLVLAAIGRPPGRRRLWLGLAAGVALALAILSQQTALADAGAAAAFLALLPGRRGWGVLAAVAVALVVVVGGAIAPFVVWAGARNVSFLLVTSFLGYTHASLPATAATLVPRLAAAVAWLAGAVAGRRSEPRRQLLWLWFGAVLLAAIAPNRPYIHFALPAVAPGVALLGGARLPAGRGWLRRWAARAGGRRLPLVGSAATSMVVAGLLLHGTSWGLYTLSLTGGYYPNFLAHALHLESTAAYRASFGSATLAEQVAAQWIDNNHLAGDPAVVWSANAWVYPLAHVEPVLPTSNLNVDEAWLGAQDVLRRVTRADPSVVVTTAHALQTWPQVQRLLAAGYRRSFTDRTISVWVRHPTASAHHAPDRTRRTVHGAG